MIRFQWLTIILDRFLWCHLKCITWVLSLFFGEASMLGHGAGIGYTGPGWAPLTISVWWPGRGLNPVLASSYSDATIASGSFVVTLLTFAMLWCLVLLIFMSNNNNSYYKAMIIVDIRLRSWFGAAPWWVSQIRPAPVDSFWVFFRASHSSPLPANMTSSVKPEVHNVRQRTQRRTEPRQYIAYT